MRKILVIDDDPGISEALELILIEEGYEVQTVDNGEYIYEMSDGNLPDLILLDLLLSGIDGREVVKKLKSEDLTKNIPVIMMSAHPKADKSVKDAGADDFIPKPFDLNELVKRIKKHLN